MNKSLILLKNLLLSTSQVNIYRHTTDKKKKGLIIGNAIGMGLLYAMLMAYCISTCIGYGKFGLIDAAPVLCAIMVSALAFVFTFLKTNGYLFNFKEYDMLVSLPFEVRTVAACKFLYMYVKSLPWYLSISFAMLIGYSIYGGFSYPVCVIWVLLSFYLPLIPMVLASFLGFIIAWIGSHFKKNNLVQTILVFILIIAAFASRFVIESVFKNGKVLDVLEQTRKATEAVSGIYLPAGWFSNAVRDLSIIDIFLLVGISMALFAVVFFIVGKFYRSINSALKSHASSKDYKMGAQKKSSVVNAIAFKEFKRMTGSTVYLTNAGVGEIMAVMFSVLVLIFGFDRIIMSMTNGAPFDPAILKPATPYFVYFFMGMISTCACSPSLEGKNYWIVQSLPIEKKTLYQGKMLYNMYLTLPFTVISTICLCISEKVNLADTILYLILGFVLCAFSSAWGCVCGVKHMRLDWENEVEVVKQGAAVGIYLFTNMLVTVALCVGTVMLGMRVDHRILTVAAIALMAVLAGVCYRIVMKPAR